MIIILSIGNKATFPAVKTENFFKKMGKTSPVVEDGILYSYYHSGTTCSRNLLCC